MNPLRVTQALPAIDRAALFWLNRGARFTPLVALLRWAGRLGDGVAWYAMIAVLPVLYGLDGIRLSETMLAVGVLSLAVYKLLKNLTGRERPYVTHAEIRLGAAALDQYSFPSGHTLHAVAFTVLMVHAHPMWGSALIPFTLLVALSRPVLGLHYPADVLAGALLGASIAGAALPWV